MIAKKKFLVNDNGVTDIGEAVGSENTPNLPQIPATQQPPVQDKISEEDMRTLELAKARLDTAVAQAKEAQAKAEVANMGYRYLILQIYMKNGLTPNDIIDEQSGTIVRNGANQRQ
jgi:hypothetical protein